MSEPVYTRKFHLAVCAEQANLCQQLYIMTSTVGSGSLHKKLGVSDSVRQLSA